MKFRRSTQSRNAETNLAPISPDIATDRLSDTEATLNVGAVAALSTLAIGTGIPTITTTYKGIEATVLSYMYHEYELSGHFLKSVVLGGLTAVSAYYAVKAGRRT